MHDRSTRAAVGALILGLGLTAGVPATAQVVDVGKLGNSPVLEIYKPGEILWLVNAFGTVNRVHAASDWTAGPGFGFNDLNSLPLARTAGGGIGIEGSARPFNNSNLVLGFSGDMVIRGARVTQDLDFPGGSLQRTFNSTVLFDQFIGGGWEFHPANRTIMIPNVRVGVVEAQSNYANFGTAVFGGSTSGFKVGWAAGGGIDVKTEGLPGLQLLWLHRDFNTGSVTWHEDEWRAGLLFSVDHLKEFFGSHH